MAMERTTLSVQQKQYKPIYSKADAFRVLELLPSSQEHNQIKARLHVSTTVSAHDTYEALSYTWDEEPFTWEKISLNETEIDITQGLSRILVALRYPNVSRRLWIDQICINQRDLSEVSSQMEMMRDIYANASRTIIYLGETKEEDSTVDSVLRVCKPLRCQIQQLAEADAQRLGSLEPAYFFAAHLSALSKHDTSYDIPSGLLFVGLERQHHLLSFFCRRWFTRLWPFQEVIVSKHKLVVRYGDNEAEWADVGFLACYLMHSKVLDQVALRERRGLEAANWVHFYWLHNKVEFSLIEMLRSARKYDATKANDKVFAILGLSGEVQQPKRNHLTVPQSLRIDTTLDTGTVYRRVATFFLERDQNLMILSFVQHVDRIISSDFPSWVPNWSQRDIGTQLWIPGLPEEECYDANPKSSHRTSPPVSGTQSSVVGLTVSGFVLTRIDGDSLEYITQKEVDAISAGVAGSALKLVRWILAMSQVTKEEQMMVLTTCRMNGRLISRTSNGMHDAKTLIDYTRQFNAFLSDLTPQLARGGSGGMSSGEIWHHDDILSAAKAELKHATAAGLGTIDGSAMKNAILSACRDRRLFSTIRGKWCLGPPACCKGDLVCILDGGRVPLILREIPTSHAGRSYQLIGESYIPGFMFGEINDIRHTLDRQEFLLL